MGYLRHLFLRGFEAVFFAIDNNAKTNYSNVIKKNKNIDGISRAQNFYDIFASRLSIYREIANRAGVSFKCLDREIMKEGVAPIWNVTSEEDGLMNIRIQGPIDSWFGFDYRDFIDTLDKANPQKINLLIESPGGFLHEGLAVYSDLQARARDGVEINTEARGLVASAAVFPYLTGKERVMDESTQIMVHEPWSMMIAVGSASEIKDQSTKVINGLESAGKVIRNILTSQTSTPSAEVDEWLKGDTWFSADEAIESGIATKSIESDAGEAGETQNRLSKEEHDYAQAVMSNILTRNYI